MLGVLLVTVVVTGGILVSSVVFLGVYGPVCLSIGALIYAIGAAVYGDLQDLKRKKP
jgi:NhaP-type Na+/H+ or K+/H+ antiporter